MLKVSRTKNLLGRMLGVWVFLPVEGTITRFSFGLWWITYNIELRKKKEPSK